MKYVIELNRPITNCMDCQYRGYGTSGNKQYCHIACGMVVATSTKRPKGCPLVEVPEGWISHPCEGKAEPAVTTTNATGYITAQLTESESIMAGIIKQHSAESAQDSKERG